MRRLFILLIFLIASVWFGLTVVRHPGFVFISYQPWMIQMPFWLAAVALLVIFSVLYLLFNSVGRLQFLWYRFNKWLQFRREHKQYSKTQHGLEMLVEGQWQKAERLFIAGINQSVEPLMNYLGAARAAQAQGFIKRRDEYLQKAYQVAPDAKLAIGIRQADLQIAQGQYQEALQVLTNLHQQWPKQARVLSMLERVYVHLGQWQKLLALLPSLKKSGALNQEQAASLEKRIYCELLRSKQYQALDQLQSFWDGVPKKVRCLPDMVYEYATQLLRFNEVNNVEAMIKKALKSAWSASLVKLYGTIPYEQVNRQLGVAGDWLKSYGPHAETYLTLGRLCVRIKLWGKARDYFQKCLDLGPNPEASLEYARLLEDIGKEQEAVEKYRDGLDAAAAG